METRKKINNRVFPFRTSPSHIIGPNKNYYYIVSKAVCIWNKKEEVGLKNNIESNDKPLARNKVFDKNIFKEFDEGWILVYPKTQKGIDTLDQITLESAKKDNENFIIFVKTD